MSQNRPQIKPYPFMINSYTGQACQDAFVLSVMSGKLYGTFLELGAFKPVRFSNTYVLETYYRWSGVMIEIDESKKAALETREAHLIIEDALTVDYEAILPKIFPSNTIDYLSLDLDPPETTFKALNVLPFDKYRFNVITYEHDAYRTDDRFRKPSREFFQDNGYHLAHADVQTTDGRVFEDWYINPEYMDRIDDSE